MKKKKNFIALYIFISILLIIPLRVYATSEVDIKNLFDYKMNILPIASLVISLILWFLYGRGENLKDKKSPYPPEGLNSLDVGFIDKEMLEEKHILSLLIYLANKGYIKISKIDDNKYFKITKIKEYDGDNKYEQIFINSLFSDKEINEVDIMNLEGKGNDISYKIRSDIDDEPSKNSATKIFLSIIIMMVVTILYITIPPLFKYGNLEGLFFPLFCQLILGFPIMFLFFYKHTKDSTCADVVMSIFWTIIFVCIPFFTTILPALLVDKKYLITYIIGIISTNIMYLCTIRIVDRNASGSESFVKVRGFKKFIKGVKKEELNNLILQDQNYFYNILPYAYSLDLFDVWLNKIDLSQIQAPSWYENSNEINARVLKSILTDTENILMSCEIKNNDEYIVSENEQVNSEIIETVEEYEEDNIDIEKIKARSDKIGSIVYIFFGISFIIFSIKHIVSSEYEALKYAAIFFLICGIVMTIYGIVNFIKGNRNDKQ